MDMSSLPHRTQDIHWAGGWIAPTEAVARRKAYRFHCSNFSVLQFPYVKIILRKRRENKREKKEGRTKKSEKKEQIPRNEREREKKMDG